jgi:hypothetical protein
MLTDGPFYTELKEKNTYSTDMQVCIENTVDKLLAQQTSGDKPGMLLGKIQSGKTKTFLGIIGLAFDSGYDLVIVLTKGTKALTNQTYQRIADHYKEFTETDDLQLFDIMSMPDNLTKWEIRQKLIIVAKKETNNLSRVYTLLFEKYEHTLSAKKVLIIDDEADYASIGYKVTDSEYMELQKIAEKINEIRRRLKDYDFLQVTATPYSLYLQPENIEITDNAQTFEPIKPAFTELVPINIGYIGGEYYFEESSDNNSAASYLFEEVMPEEIDVLREPDRRKFKIEDILISEKVMRLRVAIVNFIVGGCIRRIQLKASGKAEEKFSFIVHTEKKKASHQWQEEIVNYLVAKLVDIAKHHREKLDGLIKASYDDLKNSITVLGSQLPILEDVVKEVYSALDNDFIMITKVNSEKDINVLLDSAGQLKLRTPLNIYIGGQILDRGITIRNLIGFYYGRTPNRFQQDTVLQHSRMYGFRPLEDLAVTRFYTTKGIHCAMKRIHEFDSALREAFLKGSHKNGVVFIRIDESSRIVPCSPNKILLSTTTTLVSNKRLLPVGFSTKAKGHVVNVNKRIDELLGDYNYDKNEPVLIELITALNLIDLVYDSIEFDDGYDWDCNAFKASIEYLSSNSSDTTNKGKVLLLARKNRELSRIKLDGSFSSTPDNPETDQTVARNFAKDLPVLILLHQMGKESNGWKDCEFWWPVLMAPKNTKTVIFANDLNESKS